MKITREQLRALLALVEVTEDAELDCGELLARLPAVVERTAPGGALVDVPPEVLQHLRVCAECEEELAALLDAWRPDE